MSIKLMTLVWDNFPRGGSDKLAMLAMADWCNDQGGSLHPSISTIAKKINLKPQQARAIIHKLINEGWLSVVGNEFGGNPGQSRRYQMNVQKLSTPMVEHTPPVEHTPMVEHSYPSRGAYKTPPVEQSLTTIEPPIEPPIEHTHIEVDAEFKPKTYLQSVGVKDSLIADFLKVRKAKRAPLTLTAMAGIEREAAKAGYTIPMAIQVCCEKNWQGFDASWLDKQGKRPTPDNFENRNYGTGGKL